MGASGKNSEYNNYKLKETLEDELGKTFVYDRVEDNIDETSALNKKPIPAPKKASNSWIWWVIFLLLCVILTSRTSLKNNYGKQPIDPPPVRLPRYTP